MTPLKRNFFTLFVFLLTMLTAYSQKENLDIKYKRSSLCTLILNDSTITYNEQIQDAFINSPIPNKFNDHIIDTRLIPKQNLKREVEESLEKKSTLSKMNIGFGGAKKKKKESYHKEILNYLDSIGLAKAMVAKWFNRSELGGFDMNLVAERGLYNASDIDIKVANENERGKALLADAGEALINNSFVIVNDFKYVNKEEIASKAKGLLSVIATYSGNSDLASVAEVASTGVGVLGKGYVVKTTAYLYRLVWDETVANKFYNNFWTEDASLDLEKKKAFDETSLFTLELVGIDSGWADVQSTTFSRKDNEDLIAMATVRATDNVIAKLQKKYEVFRTKTPLLSGDPIAAKIGLKEGLEKKSKYEVLEQVLNKKGVVEYKRVGVISVDKNHIWDNRFMAEEEGEASDKDYTIFKGPKNKFYSGMLIRQLN